MATVELGDLEDLEAHEKAGGTLSASEAAALADARAHFEPVATAVQHFVKSFFEGFRDDARDNHAARSRTSSLKPQRHRRESHRGRPGHARRRRATSGPPPGDDDGPSEPPRLRLAPKPGAIYTFGVRAREVWGLA